MKTLTLIVAVIVLSITITLIPVAPVAGQQVVETPSWLIGKLTGEQKVTDRPTWRPAGLEVNITSAGTWEIDLRTPGGQQTIQGSVTAVTTDTATLRGKYTSGSNYDKEVTYTLRRQGQDGKVKGAVTADWITMNIEVTLQQAKKATDREIRTVSFSARALHFACLAEAGIPDKDTDCSLIPQP